MKRTGLSVVSALLTIVFLSSADVGAQRGRDPRDAGSARQATPGRSFSNNGFSGNDGAERTRPKFENRNNSASSPIQRNPGFTQRSFGNNDQQRNPSSTQRNSGNDQQRNPGFTPRNPSNDQRNPSTSNRFGSNHRDYSSNDNNRFGNGYPRSRYNRGNSYRSPGIYRRPYYSAPRFTSGVPYYGQRFSWISFPYVSIGFGGHNYNYYGGVFYRPFGSHFQVVLSPNGIHIGTLPLGYRRVYDGANPYYYYNGIFYNRHSDNDYAVVDPPLGAKLPELPAGAKLVTINGQHYYEQGGTYYAEEYNAKDEVLYTVVGVHGELNEAEAAKIDPGTEYEDAGTIVESLPKNCRAVTINGQDLYVSPDDTYYRQITGADGNVAYQVVGTGASDNED